MAEVVGEQPKLVAHRAGTPTSHPLVSWHCPVSCPPEQAEKPGHFSCWVASCVGDWGTDRPHPHVGFDEELGGDKSRVAMQVDATTANADRSRSAGIPYP